jgi:hypothetical protein
LRNREERVNQKQWIYCLSFSPSVCWHDVVFQLSRHIGYDTYHPI